MMKEAMLFLKYTGLALLLSLLACGSGGKNGGDGNDAQKESASVQAVVLKYDIEVSNIPLVGPQSEEVNLAISDDAVKYAGSVTLPVADDVNRIEHSSILDFSDTSQTFINSADSTYLVKFYKIAALKKASSEGETNPGYGSGYVISLVLQDETGNIGPLEQCHKFSVRSSKGQALSKSDSIPSLKGNIWVYGGGDVKDIIQNYYKMQAALFHDSTFEGLELWGILGRLGIPNDGLIDWLDNMDGLLAEADLNVELYSLGKKANVNIKVDISEFERKRLPGNYFAAPPQFKPSFGPEKSLGSKSGAE
jgi:hypothetical protein